MCSLQKRTDMELSYRRFFRRYYIECSVNSAPASKTCPEQSFSISYYIGIYRLGRKAVEAVYTSGLLSGGSIVRL